MFWWRFYLIFILVALVPPVRQMGTTVLRLSAEEVCVWTSPL